MTTTEGTPMTTGSKVRYRGETWTVLATDSDPTATVWLVSDADPDRDTMAAPQDCEVLS